jgi:acyl-CoA synthetase (AMP-forming)/AMP-acid ligase II
VACGYWQNKDETLATFAAQTTGGGGPFLRTGDLGFLCDGELCVTGRIKDLVIIAGRNIYPQDVESVVQETIGTLAPTSYAAFAVPEDGEDHLILAVEADRALYRAAQSVQESSRIDDVPLLSDFVKRVRIVITKEFDLPLRALLLVRPGRFPRTTSGKTQRQACRSAWLEGTLEQAFTWQAPSR